MSLLAKGSSSTKKTENGIQLLLGLFSECV